MELKLERTRSEYAIKVDLPDMRALLEFESGDETAGEPLYVRLGAIDGVDKVEYDGHFGPYVYVRVDVEKDDPETHRRICETISRHLETCRASAAPRRPRL